MLREAYHTVFFEAMEIKNSNHEKRCHWDLILQKDLPLGAKTIMANGHSNSSNPLTERSISIRPDYVLMEVVRLGVKTTGTHMLLSLHGLVFDFCVLTLRS